MFVTNISTQVLSPSLTTSHVTSSLFNMQTYDTEPVFSEKGLRY